MFCKVGKDRTGVLAALIAASCDASDEDILVDYHRCTAFLILLPLDLCPFVFLVYVRRAPSTGIDHCSSSAGQLKLAARS